MIMAHLVTGYAGHAHIKSSDDGALNASFFGGGQYLMELGNHLEASIVDNNTIRIIDGDGLMYGRHFRIDPNSYEDLTITTGTAGTKRIDLICMTYERNSDDETESVYLQVIKGKEVAGTPELPEYTDGNILEGASFNQMPLYKVMIEGVVLSKIERLAEVIPSHNEVIKSMSNQNLLVNGDFKVNQRGKTKYDNSTSSLVHTVDRWRINGLTVVVNDDHSLTITNDKSENARNFMQVFNMHLKDEVYTASCKVRSVSGQVRMFYGSFADDLVVGLNTFTFPKASMNTFIINLSVGASVTLEWVKLEQGSVATTFAPPVYSDELLRCGFPDDSADTGCRLDGIGKGHVVDNLLSDSADLPLSAKQGKLLAEMLGVDSIQVVSALPSDASSHPNTFYLVKG